jgi:hypothetical protein
MISAVRKGPTRTVDTKIKKMPAAVAILIPTRATHPASVCGGCHVCVRADSAARPGDDLDEHVGDPEHDGRSNPGRDRTDDT